MANYECTMRTNFFRVKDETTFKDFMNRVYVTEDAIETFEKVIDGVKHFGFGCYGSICGVVEAPEDVDADDCDPDDYNYDAFINGLQKLVADDDAVIIFEAGSEKLRYVVGAAEVITSKSYKAINLDDLALKTAAELLGNPEWTSFCSY